MRFILRRGGGRVWRRCRVSYVTGASNDIGLQLGKACYPYSKYGCWGMFYFCCFFTFISVPLSSLSLSFISSTISSISFLLFSGRRHKMTQIWTSPFTTCWLTCFSVMFHWLSFRAFMRAKQSFYIFSITKTYLYNFDPLKPNFYIVKLGFTGIFIIFLISAQNHRLWVLVGQF